MEHVKAAWAIMEEVSPESDNMEWMSDKLSMRTGKHSDPEWKARTEFARVNFKQRMKLHEENIRLKDALAKADSQIQVDALCVENTRLRNLIVRLNARSIPHDIGCSKIRKYAPTSCTCGLTDLLKQTH